MSVVVGESGSLASTTSSSSVSISMIIGSSSQFTLFGGDRVDFFSGVISSRGGMSWIMGDGTVVSDGVGLGGTTLGPSNIDSQSFGSLRVSS